MLKLMEQWAAVAREANRQLLDRGRRHEDYERLVRERSHAEFEYMQLKRGVQDALRI